MIAEKIIVLLKNLYYPSLFNAELKMELPQIGVTTFKPEYELSSKDFYGDLPVIQTRSEEFAKQFDKINAVYAKPFGLLGAGKIKDDIDGIDFIFLSQNEFLCNLFFEKKNDVYVLKYAGYKRKSYHDSRRIMEAFCKYVSK